jgi:thioredoxin reductase (NADPH)
MDGGTTVLEPLHVIVVGGGIAGLVAAREAAAAGAQVTHVMGSDVMGGLVANVGVLDNFSGGDVAGIDLATTLFTDASELGVAPVMENATAIGIEDGRLFVAAEARLDADRIIVATGARLRRLDVPGVETLVDRGVSYCGWCDGPLHRGKRVVVIGGGDAAVQEALHVATIAEHVTLLVRGAGLKARPDYADRLQASSNIALSLGTEVLAVLGDEAVTGVRVRATADGQEQLISCSGVFPFIGLLPATDACAAGIARDGRGALLTDERLMTSLPGVYAAGAVRAGSAGTLDDAIDEARRAADHAVRLPG